MMILSFTNIAVTKFVRKCVHNSDIESVLSFCHDGICGGHFSGHKTIAKILQCGFYWPTLFKDAFKYCKSMCFMSKVGGEFQKET